MELTGKKAFVTGAAAGIGRAIADRFARAGATLTLADIDANAVETVAAALTARGGQAKAVALDMGDVTAVERAIEQAAAAMDGLDILINNAGVATQKPLVDHTVADFERIYRVNVFGLFAAMRAAAVHMIATGRRGRIVNVASVAGIRGSTGRSAYGSSKAAVINLSQVGANELSRKGITVNVIAPGPIETPMVKGMHTPGTRAGWLEEIPMGRYGEPEDIAETALYLASDGAGFVTGQVLCVDGGFAATGLLIPLDQL